MLNLIPLALILVSLFQVKILTKRGEFHRDYLSREQSSAIKGILAIVILLHHLGQEVMETGGNAPLLLLFAHIGGVLPVAMFFFYSGYGLQKKYMTSPHYEKGFLQKRVPTVLLPYLIVTLLCWGQSWLLGDPYSVRDVVGGFYDGFPIVRFSWFILELIFFYFVFYLLMKICRKHFSAMLPGALVYLVLWNLVCRRAYLPAFWYSYTHTLIIGMAWAIFEGPIEKAVHRLGWPGILTMLFVFLLAASVSHFGGSSFNEILVVLFLFAVIPVLTKVRFYNPVLKFLGSISYEIYLLQGFFLTALRNDVFYLESNFLFCLFALGLTLFFGWIAHLLFGMLLKGYRKLFKI